MNVKPGAHAGVTGRQLSLFSNAQRNLDASTSSLSRIRHPGIEADFGRVVNAGGVDDWCQRTRSRVPTSWGDCGPLAGRLCSRAVGESRCWQCPIPDGFATDRGLVVVRQLTWVLSWKTEFPDADFNEPGARKG